MALCEDPNIDGIDFEKLCKCGPGTNISANLVSGRISSTDDSFTVKLENLTTDEFPCCGFGRFTGCRGGVEELFYYDDISENTEDGTIILTGLVRGLSRTGCDVVQDDEAASEHFRSEELLLGTTDIHYYMCKICQHLLFLKDEVRNVYPTVGSLPDCEIEGQRAIVSNGGKPLLFVCLNGKWRQTVVIPSIAEEGSLGSVGLICEPQDPSNPLVYNRGCDVLDAFYDNTVLCGPNFAIQGHAVNPEYGSRIQAEHICVEGQTITGDNTTINFGSITTNMLYDLHLDGLINKISDAAGIHIENYTIQINGENFVGIGNNNGTQVGIKGLISSLPAGTYTVDLVIDLNDFAGNYFSYDFVSGCIDLILNPVCDGS